MKSSSILCCLSAALVLVAAVAGFAQAAPARVESFDTSTWAALEKELPRPAIVAFSTTDCTHCPAVIEDIVRHRGRKIGLVVVVMDGAESGAALRQVPYYAKADRLLVFADEEARLRYGVDPRWRAVTPYLVLLHRNGERRNMVGSMKANDWVWLKQHQ